MNKIESLEFESQFCTIDYGVKIAYLRELDNIKKERKNLRLSNIV